MKNYFIINPVAGKGKAIEIVEKQIELVSEETKKDNKFIIIHTHHSGEGTEICKEICEENTNEVINVFACGGDGTCFEVLNGIMGYKNVRFGMLPVGSCNDFLKTFPGYDFLDIEKQIKGETIEVDTVKVNGEYIINVVNFGFDARANDDQLKLRSKYKSVKKAYNRALVKNILSPKLGDTVVVTVDGKNVFDGKMLLSAAANAKFYGGGYKCAPLADVTDGLIDLVIVKKVSILTFARLVKYYKAGDHLLNERFNKYVTFVKGKDIKIKAKKDLTASFDGEVRHDLNYHININDKKVNFILPSAN